MVPRGDFSADKQRLEHIGKQGNSLLGFLLAEAAQAAARITQLATSVHPPGDASAQEHRQSRAGKEAGGSLVLDVEEQV